MARILIVDDEQSIREFLEILLKKRGHEVEAIGDVTEALQRVAGDEFDLVITDLRLGKATGLDVLEAVKRFHPATEVVMITAFATADNAIAAMKAGAYDYVTKPFKVDEIGVVVQKALEKRSLVRENARLREELGERRGLAGLVGQSPAMQALYGLVEKVAPTKSTVLITGESGTGKELVARAVHQLSPRAAAPFVAVNCGAIPEGLMESELFGHERGAFTGAHQAKVGLFEAGSGGTVFLDEIGELPPALQVKLLRVLQERTVKRVGGAREIEVDVRVIAATNRDLSDDVAAGRFREDLFYRLNVILIAVPPLRDRREDVLLLAESFLARFAENVGREALTLDADARGALRAYAFPGNVRELENLMERAATLAESSEIGLDLLPPAVAEARGVQAPPVEVPEAGFDLQAYLDAVERAYLEKALEASGGVKTEAAKLLGLSFRSLRYRLAKYGL
jgi:two-component system, NtrC family, response regulator PilR